MRQSAVGCCCWSPSWSKFRFEERDPDLTSKLEPEWPAILRWAVDGCLGWQQRGLDVPASVRRTSDDYFAGQDTLEQWIEDWIDGRDPKTSPQPDTSSGAGSYGLNNGTRGRAARGTSRKAAAGKADGRKLGASHPYYDSWSSNDDQQLEDLIEEIFADSGQRPRHRRDRGGSRVARR